VDQELLLRNEYLAAENRILKAQLQGACGSRMPSERDSARSATDWAARLSARLRPRPQFWKTFGRLPKVTRTSWVASG
jgi:hypothetical protein